MSINRVAITGNLCAEPNLRTTPSGMSILELRVAVNDRRKNAQTGQWEDAANFVDVTMFGTRAAAVAPYLGKGGKVAVDGKLREDTWQDKTTGQKRSKLRIIADDIELLGGKQKPQQQEQDDDELPMPEGW